MNPNAQRKSFKRKVLLALTLPLALGLSACTLMSTNTISADGHLSLSAMMTASQEEVPPGFNCEKGKEYITEALGAKNIDLKVNDTSNSLSIVCKYETAKPIPIGDSKSSPLASLITHKDGEYIVTVNKIQLPKSDAETDKKIKEGMKNLSFLVRYEFPGEVTDPGPGIATGNAVELVDFVSMSKGYTIKAKDAPTTDKKASAAPGDTAKPAPTNAGSVKPAVKEKGSSWGFSWLIIGVLIFFALLIVIAVVVGVIISRKKPSQQTAPTGDVPPAGPGYAPTMPNAPSMSGPPPSTGDNNGQDEPTSRG